MKRKYLALVLASAMVVTALAGCGSKEEASTEAPAAEEKVEEEAPAEEPAKEEAPAEEAPAEEAAAGETQWVADEMITIHLGGAKPSGLEDWTNLACLEEYKNRLGVELVADGLVETDWATERTLLIAEDALPDMLINAGFGINELTDYGNQGYFLDFSQYLDIMPNLQATFEEYPDYKAYITTETGAIYGFCRIRSDYTDRLMRTFIKGSWLEAAGKEVPTTLDELYEVMVAFKEMDVNGNGDPDDEIPMLWAPNSYPGIDRTILDAFGIYGSGWGGNTYILEEEDGVVSLAQTSDRYKEFLKWMKKCFDEGLIEPEAFTIESGVVESKAREDLYGMFGCGSAPFVVLNNNISEDKAWEGMGGLASEWNPDHGMSIGPAVDTSMDVVVSSTVENPEAVAKFIDYFFSPEGMLAGALGYEGQFFHWTDHEILGTIPVWDIIPEGYASAEEYRYKGSVFNGGFNLHESNLDRVALFNADPEKMYEDSIETEYGWAALVAQAYNREGVTIKDTFPNLAYTLAEADERATLRTDVRNYISQMRAEFITGQTDIDAGWDAYVETCNNMGLTRLLEIEQAAYDRAYK